MSAARNVGALTTRELEYQERVAEHYRKRLDSEPEFKAAVDALLAKVPLDDGLRVHEYPRKVSKTAYEHGTSLQVAFIGSGQWAELDLARGMLEDIGCGMHFELACPGGLLRIYEDPERESIRGAEWVGRYQDIPESARGVMGRVRAHWKWTQLNKANPKESIKVVADPACPPDRTYAVTPSMVDAVLWNVRHTPSPLPSSATAYDALTSSLASAKRAFDTYDPLSARETPGYDAYDQLVPYVDPDAKLAYALFLTDPEVIALASRVGDFEFTVAGTYHLDEPKRDRTYRRIWDTDDGGHRSRCEARCRAMLEVP